MHSMDARSSVRDSLGRSVIFQQPSAGSVQSSQRKLAPARFDPHWRRRPPPACQSSPGPPFRGFVWLSHRDRKVGDACVLGCERHFHLQDHAPLCKSCSCGPGRADFLLVAGSHLRQRILQHRRPVLHCYLRNVLFRFFLLERRGAEPTDLDWFGARGWTRVLVQELLPAPRIASAGRHDCFVPSTLSLEPCSTFLFLQSGRFGLCRCSALVAQKSRSCPGIYKICERTAAQFSGKSFSGDLGKMALHRPGEPGWTCSEHPGGRSFDPRAS